ncbi:MAG TPA: YncE family protein, partial [Puia sp.]|nr:YncE family protein [Puia sp.]
MRLLLLSLFSTIALIFITTHNADAQGPGPYHLQKTFKIGSPGGWDYIAVGPDKKIYVSHGTQVNILDLRTGDSVGVIPNTTGVHGIAFDEALGKGYTSNGRLNSVTVFDLKTSQVLRQIPVGQNPDAIMFDPFSKKIITCNGRGRDLSVIDPVTEQVMATVSLEGKPETAVSDEAGRIFINIE